MDQQKNAPIQKEKNGENWRKKRNRRRNHHNKNKNREANAEAVNEAALDALEAQDEDIEDGVVRVTAALLGNFGNPLADGIGAVFGANDENPGQVILTTRLAQMRPNLGALFGILEVFDKQAVGVILLRNKA